MRGSASAQTKHTWFAQLIVLFSYLLKLVSWSRQCSVNHFNKGRHLINRDDYKVERSAALVKWRSLTNRGPRPLPSLRPTGVRVGLIAPLGAPGDPTRTRHLGSLNLIGPSALLSPIRLHLPVSLNHHQCPDSEADTKWRNRPVVRLVSPLEGSSA